MLDVTNICILAVELMRYMSAKFFLSILAQVLLSIFCLGGDINGVVRSNDKPVAFATVGIVSLGLGTVTDSIGVFVIADVPPGQYDLTVNCIGYMDYSRKISVGNKMLSPLNIEIVPQIATFDEVVVSGTLSERSQLNSTILVDVLTPKLFSKNPTAGLLEAVGMINGVQPQMNCNVCNTGDIHINGMEGPYTLILIDGMPIVSALSSVYGLSGIPNSLVERIEIVKGPAASLYGSEAMGGIVNVITKNPDRAPKVTTDIFATSWGEVNTDAAVKFKTEKASGLLGVNYFYYQNKIDKNGDGFTDLTLQNRVSIFNKWSLKRPESRVADIAARYVYEDRWGGQLDWGKQWRGSDSIYGESIYTRRIELIARYQLPTTEKIYTQFSYNWHDQNSYYGIQPFMATQQVSFGQIYWDKKLDDRNSLLLGSSLRHTIYNDDTVITASEDGTTDRPAQTVLPGVFVQDELQIGSAQTLLAGYRYDYERNHGNVHSPRIAYKIAAKNGGIFRMSFGTGYRVVNLFTEDHAALTGARSVVIAEKLNPERSKNGTINYSFLKCGSALQFKFNVSTFYSLFTNKIVGDFLIDPDKIIYDNLRGFAVSRGGSFDLDLKFTSPLKLNMGVTFMDVYQVEKNMEGLDVRTQQLYAPKWSGTFVASYSLVHQFSIDITGKWNGPMKLPILPDDYRPEYSPWFCIANIQVTKKFSNGVEIYCGVKNLFNFVPKDPIMRAFDPFDKTANDPISNPNGYTFDPGYMYSSMQGVRGFAGIRYLLY